MGRGMQLAVLGAALVGSAGGGLAALLSTPEAPDPPPPAPVAVAPIVQPLPAAPAPAPDPSAQLVAQITTVLERFVEWTRDHAGAPCPELAALGVASLDPWGHPLELTCTDQPADQIVGVSSSGPDGQRGTSDDVTSWTLGPAITERVRGARWKAAPSSATGKRRRDRPPAPTATTIAPQPPPPVPPPGPPRDAGDDIPSKR